MSTSISESEVLVTQVRLFPTPNMGDNTFIDLSDEKINNVSLEVYTIHGQLIYTKQYNGQNPSLLEIPSVNFAQGLYIVNLSSVKGKVWIGRFVKM